MNTTQDIDPTLMPPEVQRAFFAVAYWMASADGLLRPREQEWFERQFGAQAAHAFLEEFTAMEPDRVAEVAGDLPALLSPEQRQQGYAALRPWLLSLAHADSFFAVQERKVLVEILRSLGIRVRSPLFVVKGSVPAWQFPRHRHPRLKAAAWGVFAAASTALFVVTAVTWLMHNPITYGAAALCTVLVMLLMIVDPGA